MRVTGDCELCGQPGHRVQVKARGGNLRFDEIPQGRDRIILCYQCLYRAHSFKTMLWSADDERLERAAARRERLLAHR